MSKHLIAAIPLCILAALVGTTSVKADPTSDAVTIAIDPSITVAKISSNFIGLGYETSAVAEPNLFSGKNTKMIRLYRNLSPNGLIRIGGNVSDHTVYQPLGTAVAATERETTLINQRNLADLGDFAQATGWNVMWGLNTETDTEQDGVDEAVAVVNSLGGNLQSFEIGNEVEWHPAFSKNFDKYDQYYKSFKKAIRAVLPSAPFSGPDAVSIDDWPAKFAASEAPDVKLLTAHYYRGYQADPSTSIATLLTTDDHFAQQLQYFRGVSQKFGVPYRLNEFNSFSGGGRPGVSDTFAAALWALDVAYQAASYGCSGINFETDVNQLGFISHYSPIVHDSTGGCSVRAEYYGLLAFAITGHGDIVQTSVSKDGVNLTAYTTCEADFSLWLTVINKDLVTAADVTVAVPEGYKSLAALRLNAPAVDSLDSVTLGGSSVDKNGDWKATSTERLADVGGTATFTVPSGSAALIHITR